MDGGFSGLNNFKYNGVLGEGFAKIFWLYGGRSKHLA